MDEVVIGILLHLLAHALGIGLAGLLVWWLIRRLYPLEPYEPYVQHNRKPWPEPEPPPPAYFEYLKEHATDGFYPGGVSTRMVIGFGEACGNVTTQKGLLV